MFRTFKFRLSLVLALAFGANLVAECVEPEFVATPRITIRAADDVPASPARAFILESRNNVTVLPLPKHLPTSLLLTDADIVRYDWKTHRIHLTAEAASRINRPTFRLAQKYVLSVDGAPLHYLWWHSIIDSTSPPGIHFYVEQVERDRCIELLGATVWDRIGKKSRKHVSDGRLRGALRELGKLRE
jgi:hypothetical protein